MSAPEDVLLVVAHAIGEVEEGRPVDLDRLRAKVTGAADQLRGMGEDRRADQSGRDAGNYLALVTEALLVAVDRLQAGDVAGARAAVRDALWAPSGRPAPEAPA